MEIMPDHIHLPVKIVPQYGVHKPIKKIKRHTLKTKEPRKGGELMPFTVGVLIVFFYTHLVANRAGSFAG